MYQRPYSGKFDFPEGNSGDVVEALKGIIQAKIVESSIMQPVDVQSRYSTTIQSHNAVTLPATSGFSDSSYFDVSGFDKISISALNDTAANMKVELFWSNDGSTRQGIESLFTGATNKEPALSTDVKARWVRVRLSNLDAAVHVMSAWIYPRA